MRCNKYTLLIQHMQACDICKQHLGLPIYEVHIKLCFEAQQLIAKGKLLDAK